MSHFPVFLAYFDTPTDYLRNNLPNFSPSEQFPSPRYTTMKLDRYDRLILDALQHDGSLSNNDVAERVGLSASPCSRRIRQLEDAGVIAQRVVRLAPEKLGLDLTVLLHIRMDKHTPERFGKFESIVESFPEVQECYLITGQEADYQLKVIVPNMSEYQQFLLGKITRIDGVIGVVSTFVLRRAVDTTAVPLTYLPQNTKTSD